MRKAESWLSEPEKPGPGAIRHKAHCFTSAAGKGQPGIYGLSDYGKATSTKNKKGSP